MGGRRAIPHGQLKLPLSTEPRGARMARPFGLNGQIVFRVVGDHELEIVEVRWPPGLAQDPFAERT